MYTGFRRYGEFGIRPTDKVHRFANIESTPTDERDNFFFSPFQITHKGVFVFGEIGVGTGNLAMQQTFLDLADKEAQLVFAQGFNPRLFEILELADGPRVGDPRSLRHGGKIRVARRRRRVADATAAVNAVVENIND